MQHQNENIHQPLQIVQETSKIKELINYYKIALHLYKSTHICMLTYYNIYILV